MSPLCVSAGSYTMRWAWHGTSDSAADSIAQQVCLCYGTPFCRHGDANCYAMPHGVINLGCALAAKCSSLAFCASLVRGLTSGTAASVTLMGTPCAVCGFTRRLASQPHSRPQPSTATGAAPVSGYVCWLYSSVACCHLRRKLCAASSVYTPLAR